MAQQEYSQRIVVIGVGGAGGNAVNNMIAADIKGVEFIAANTDYQALQSAQASTRIQLGANLTGGRGAGMNPDIGMRAAEESAHEVEAAVKGADMVFVAAGMGGGTGTGAAPLIAKIARQAGALTVAVVTKPFNFEGNKRAGFADQGIEAIRDHVDALIVIPNQNLMRLASNQLTVAKAFQMADDVLQQGVRGITDLVTAPGLINLDFADVRTVMTDMGFALMGTGEAAGENRAVEAARQAIRNPLLDDLGLEGAKGLLINISGGDDLSLIEVDEAANFIRDQVKTEATIIFGAALSPGLTGSVRVSVVAAGLQPGTSSAPSKAAAAPEPAKAEAAPAPASHEEEARKPLIVAPGAGPAESFDEEPEAGDFGADPNEAAEPPPIVSAVFAPASERLGVAAMSMTASAIKPEPAAAAIAPTAPDDDLSDELDIPAFLRRNSQS